MATPTKLPEDRAVEFDFPKRSVRVSVRKGLDLHPTTLDIPFAVLKVIAAQILSFEAEHEVER